ncbi:MAG TPA: hypothetical protein VFU31_22945 [Candidatus Binatia bacterium]|nr:hypothetical protein [Candidatus Binatia bacterium]
MVSDKIVSRYAGKLPESANSDRGIPHGPLYPVAEVLGLLENSVNPNIQVWTRKCAADVQKLALDADDLVDLLKEAVLGNHFIGSEWCRQNPNGPWAACDAYALSRQEWVAVAHKEIRMEYYLKFSVGKTGKILLLASCHLSEERRSQ